MKISNKKTVLTKRDCYEELKRATRIVCYQTTPEENLDFFRAWIQTVLQRIALFDESKGGDFSECDGLVCVASMFCGEKNENCLIFMRRALEYAEAERARKIAENESMKQQRKKK